VRAFFRDACVIHDCGFNATVTLQSRQGIVVGHPQRRAITPGRVSDELLQRLMLGFDTTGSNLRRNRLNALALDWQKQSCAVIAQWLSAIRMINRFRQQRDIIGQIAARDLFVMSGCSSSLNLNSSGLKKPDDLTQ
jgi:hypothetical protein